MHSDIKATQLELTPAIYQYIEEKTGQLEKFLDSSDTTVHAQVEVEKTTEHHQSGDIFRAEINLRTSFGAFYADATHEDLYAALDEVKDKIAKELRRAKQKHEDSVRKGGTEGKALLQEGGEEA